MDPKFDAFNITDVTWKTLNDHPFKAAILIPKNIKPGPVPVLVHFHGGGLVFGSRLYASWWANWLVQLAESRGAVIVSPDHRLVPEATVSDILDDLESFWGWVHSTSSASGFSAEVAKIAPPGVRLRLDRIAVGGESAGGYLSIMSALLLPASATRIAVAMPQYGAMDFAHPQFSAAGPKHLMGAPKQPASAIDDYVTALPAGAIRTSSTEDGVWMFAMAVTLHGAYPRFLGRRDDVYIHTALQRAERVPPLWVLQGKDDSIVPAECTTAFVDKVRALHPDAPLHYSLEAGEHGFDGPATVDDAWVREGFAFVSKYWP